MTDRNDRPDDAATPEGGTPAAEALEAAREAKAAEKRRLAGLNTTQIGIGIGVGSAALLAALLYTRKNRKK